MMVMEMNKITSNCSQDNSENNTQFVFLLVLKHLNSEDKAKKPENIEICNFRVFFVLLKALLKDNHLCAASPSLTRPKNHKS